MLKLIKCEFWKLRRKKIILLVIIASFLFPIPMAFVSKTPQVMSKCDGSADMFNGLFSTQINIIQFILPCMLGIIAAILFFSERDNGTFKNLRTIPITSKQMILAKISVLFILNIIFCLTSTIATILCGVITSFKINGLLYKFLLSIEMGFFTTAGILPLVVLIVFFSRSYIFSILLCVFYCVLNFSMIALYDTLPKSILLAFPTPLTAYWSVGDMGAHGITQHLSELQRLGLIPSTLRVVITLGIMAAVSIFLIIRLYKKWEE